MLVSENHGWIIKLQIWKLIKSIMTFLWNEKSSDNTIWRSHEFFYEEFLLELQRIEFGNNLYLSLQILKRIKSSSREFLCNQNRQDTLEAKPLDTAN